VRHDALFTAWAAQSHEDWDASPIALPRLAHELWNVIRHEDWVLTASTLQDWTLKLWDFDKPYRHAGRALGTGTQIGVSLGVALAHRGTGRLVVDIQPDGDLMFDAGALWTAAKNNIPFLVVMYNNRAYFNDWEHQIHVAEHRGTPVERAHIGQDITGPEPDFATLALLRLVRRGTDRKARRHRAGTQARDCRGEGRAPGAGRHDSAAAVRTRTITVIARLDRAIQ
jgi:acetolactate synthase I/II/III large subunit